MIFKTISAAKIRVKTWEEEEEIHYKVTEKKKTSYKADPVSLGQYLHIHSTVVLTYLVTCINHVFESECHVGVLKSHETGIHYNANHDYEINEWIQNYKFHLLFD